MLPFLTCTSLLLAVAAVVSGNSNAEQTDHSVAVVNCPLQTLRDEFVVIDCFNFGKTDNVVDTDASLFVAPGTHCRIRCSAGQRKAYRLCDNGGYWAGHRLECRQSSDKDQALVRPKRGWFRSAKRVFNDVGKAVVKGAQFVGGVTGIDTSFGVAVACYIGDLLTFTWCPAPSPGSSGGAAYTTPTTPRPGSVPNHDDDGGTAPAPIEKVIDYVKVLPPKIQCHPPSTTFTAEEGRCDAIVTWDDATASDGASVQQTSPTARSGNWFNRGSHIVTYMATNANGLHSTCMFSFEVKVEQCWSMRHPRYGYYDCQYNEECPMSTGTECTAVCDERYEMTGNPTMKCRSGRWEGDVVTCSKKKCPNVIAPMNGILMCNADNSLHSTCMTVCLEGFRLPRSATRYITCRDDQTWSGTLSACEDAEPPVFKSPLCERQLILEVFADRAQDSAVVNWSIPIVDDNVDQDITPVPSNEDMLPGSPIKVGMHEIEYTARDSAQNEAVPCRFKIHVRETICPSIERKKGLTISCPQELVYGQSCNFTCDPFDMIGDNLTTCERSDSAPSMGFWSNEPPKCDVKTCTDITELPDNGALACSEWGDVGIYCEMSCHEDFNVPRNYHYEYFVCSYLNGSWSHKPDDCTKKYYVDEARKKNWQHYYSDDCTSNETQKLIKERFVSSMKSSNLQAMCGVPGSCGFDNVVVKCGPVSRRKRDVTLDNQMGSDAVSKRNTGGTMWRYAAPVIHRSGRVKRSYTHKLEITYDFFIELPHDPDVDAGKRWAEISDTFASMKNNTQQKIASGQLNLEIEGFPTVIDAASYVTDEYPTLHCPPNSEPKPATFTCAVCPTCTYYDSASEKCIHCPVGTYQDKENQTSCEPCPEGKSTLETGTRDLDECMAMCAAGSYSPTGLIPCAKCTQGTYQPQQNMKTCIQCPPATLTPTTGSTALVDCQAFQLDTLAGGTVTVSNIVSADTDSWSVTFWLMPTSNNVNIFSLVKDDVIFQLKNSSALSYDFIGTTRNTEVNLVVKKWHHITVVWNGDKCHLKLYAGGKLAVTQDMTGQCSVTLTSTTLMKFGSANPEASFSGSVTMVSVWDSALDDVTITERSHSCLYNDSAASFGWQMVKDANRQNMTMRFPTTCDVTDNCDPDPCHGYLCEDKLNDFVCHCKGGFTGKTCDVPPDFCVSNLCDNGATCLSGSMNYTCQCALGFWGQYCQDEIVNGGYGPWSEWSLCSKTCGTGVESRSRLCNDPEPDPVGLQCTGPSSATQDCNTDHCPECHRFKEFRGLLRTNVSCSTDNDDETKCYVSCLPGTTPVRPIENPYLCGPSTNYVWSHKINKPRAHLPSCERSKVPDRGETLNAITYNVPSVNLVNHVEKNLSSLVKSSECVQSGRCTVETEVIPLSGDSRRRRDTTDEYMLILSVSAMSPQINYISNDTYNASAESLALSNWAYITHSLVAVSALIKQAEETGGLSATVDGVTYSPVNGSLLQLGMQFCLPPMVTSPVTLMCVRCPPGTYTNRSACAPCEEGEYQDEAGQLECKPCPDGTTTPFTEATSVTDCTVPVATSTRNASEPTAPSTTMSTAYDSHREGQASNMTTTVIAVVVTIVIICLVVAVVVVLYVKKHAHQKRRRVSTMKDGMTGTTVHVPTYSVEQPIPLDERLSVYRPVTPRNIYLDD